MSLFINATENKTQSINQVVSNDTQDTIIFSLGEGMEDISLEPKDESMIRKKNIASLEESKENGFCYGWISTICFPNSGNAKPFFTCNVPREQPNFLNINPFLKINAVKDENNFPWEITKDQDLDFLTFNINRFEQRAPQWKKEFTWATTSPYERKKDYAEYVDLTSEPKVDFQSQLKRLDQERYVRVTETFCKCVELPKQSFSDPVRHICLDPSWE